MDHGWKLLLGLTLVIAALVLASRHTPRATDVLIGLPEPMLPSDGPASAAKQPTVLPSTGNAVRVDSALPQYEPTEGVSGTIKCMGSDTMNNIMALWAEGFRQCYPSVRIEVEGKGSSTAPPALTAETADFGPMSRDLSKAEIDAFERRFGYPPVQLPVAIDMLAVFVHRDNPLVGVTLQQLDAVFSKHRRAGAKRDIVQWNQLGTGGQWIGRPISLYGRNAASGTYGYFKEHVLLNGDFKDTVKGQPGSSAVIQGVGSDRDAMGYSGIGYRTADVRVLPVGSDNDSTLVPAEAEYAYSRDYPLVRFLWLTVNYKPGGRLDPLKREFIKYVYSRQGQSDVIRQGFLPLSAPVATKALHSVGIEAPRE